MNSGGEPERDDTGLPPVDIEIPDDARELDRDVQAYHREQRAVRRHLRSRRMRRVLARDSMVVPLLISCLIFALIAGTLLTLFTATSIDQNLPGQGNTARPTAGTNHSSAEANSSAGATASAGARPTAHGSAAAGGRASGRPAAPAKPGPSGGTRGSPRPTTHGKSGSPAAPATAPEYTPTPAAAPVLSAPSQVANAYVMVREYLVPLRTLQPAMLLIVPAGCDCTAAISELTTLSLEVGARPYLVATPATLGQTGDLAERLSNGLLPVEDISHSLSAVPVVGLTAIFVGTDGSVSYAQRLEFNSMPIYVFRAAHL